MGIKKSRVVVWGSQITLGAQQQHYRLSGVEGCDCLIRQWKEVCVFRIMLRVRHEGADATRGYITRP
jgi:hypothetical protein